uniref:Uncharacterized protein n=1 Tax=Nothobranchius furzeri TaxID=105023 RepID=A0A8C6Q4G9_NOTFU
MKEPNSPAGSPPHSPHGNGLDRAQTLRKELPGSSSTGEAPSTPNPRSPTPGKTKDSAQVRPSIAPSSFPSSPALRSPMSVPPGSYPAHFGVVSHAGLNGELASPGGFGGALTLSPQISAAASAYSRSPMVSRMFTPLSGFDVWFGSDPSDCHLTVEMFDKLALHCQYQCSVFVTRLNLSCLLSLIHFHREQRFQRR